MALGIAVVCLRDRCYRLVAAGSEANATRGAELHCAQIVLLEDRLIAAANSIQRSSNMLQDYAVVLLMRSCFTYHVLRLYKRSLAKSTEEDRLPAHRLGLASVRTTTVSSRIPFLSNAPLGHGEARGRGSGGWG